MAAISSTKALKISSAYTEGTYNTDRSIEFLQRIIAEKPKSMGEVQTIFCEFHNVTHLNPTAATKSISDIELMLRALEEEVEFSIKKENETQEVRKDPRSSPTLPSPTSTQTKISRAAQFLLDTNGKFLPIDPNSDAASQRLALKSQEAVCEREDVEDAFFGLVDEDSYLPLDGRTISYRYRQVSPGNLSSSSSEDQLAFAREAVTVQDTISDALLGTLLEELVIELSQKKSK